MTAMELIARYGGPIKAEREADRLFAASFSIENDLCGAEGDGDILDSGELGGDTDDLDAEAAAIMAALPIADPATRAIIEPYTTAGGHKEARAIVTTAGGRAVWSPVSFNPSGHPAEVSDGQARTIRAALHEGKRTTLTL